MLQVRLISLMKAPVRLWLGGRLEDELIIIPSGNEIKIMLDSRTVCMAGEGHRAAIINEFPVHAAGIPEEVDRWIRYIVPVIAYEAVPDRKDFVTPSRPIRGSDGIVRAYRHLRGHAKADVLSFFKEAEALKGGTQ